jgi:HSP20 family protein
MENKVINNNGCSSYPGTYVPLMREEEMRKELKRSQEGKRLLPPVNIAELSDCFKVEVAIPGVKREDFLIQADGNILSVFVLHKDCGCHESEWFKLHEFNYECFDRPIILPGNADAEFTCAEYKEGILHLYVPKTNQPVKNLHTRIVVY